MNQTVRLGALSASQGRPAIEIRNLVKRYGEFAAVDDVSLSVDPGVFVTLLGPSGCGKSTLLRSIAGFAKPNSGSIIVDGRDITHELSYRRPVSMVFQDYALFPHMTVRQNIAFGCEMQGQSKAAIAERCEQMLALIHLPEVGDRYPAQLSGGQQQRIALARALAPDPVSLLLDEPLGALDLKLRRQMQQELKHIQRQTGKTFLFVTHDQEEAMSMSDRIAVMRDGRIQQLGSPEDVYRNPATAFVAGFIGDANMIPARVVGQDGQAIVLEAEVAGQTWRVPASRVTAAAMPGIGDPVMLVVRPEDMRVVSGGDADALVMPAQLVDRTFLGGRVRLELCANDGAKLTAEARRQDFDHLGDVVDLYCRPSDIAIVPRAPDGAP